MTIIGSDGRVLYDNEADSVAMGNHSSAVTRYCDDNEEAIRPETEAMRGRRWRSVF